MAVKKKPSGLGKGLEELLEDNTPSKRAARPLVEPKGEVSESKSATPPPQTNTLYSQTQRSLYEPLPRTRSVKSNFKK